MISNVRSSEKSVVMKVVQIIGILPALDTTYNAMVIKCICSCKRFSKWNMRRENDK